MNTSTNSFQPFNKKHNKLNKEYGEGDTHYAPVSSYKARGKEAYKMARDLKRNSEWEVV